MLYGHMAFYEKKNYVLRTALKSGALSLSVLFIFAIVAFLIRGEVANLEDVVIELIIFCAAILCAVFYNKRAFDYFNGAEGEEAVAAELRQLDERHAVFHSLYFGSGGDCDFAVIGPTGAFSIEVKAWNYPTAAKVLAASAQAKRAASRMGREIQKRFGQKVWVGAVLVIVTGGRRYIPNLGEFDGVWVCTPAQLNQHILNRAPYQYQNFQRIVDGLAAI